MQEISLSNSQTTLSKKKINLKSENTSTDIAVIEPSSFLLQLPWISSQKGSKKQFQKQVITNENHSGYIERNRLWTMVDSIFIYSFRMSLGMQYPKIQLGGLFYYYF